MMSDDADQSLSPSTMKRVFTFGVALISFSLLSVDEFPKIRRTSTLDIGLSGRSRGK